MADPVYTRENCMMNTMIRCEECFYREDANIPNAIYCKLNHETFSLPVYACENGRPKAKNPKTRLEILQSMTAEEFAKWLDDEYVRANWCDVDALINESCDDKPCVECIVKWLNEEEK